MAAQVRGAVLAGENTAGCVDYGNVETKDPLPHSRILVAFGRNPFHRGLGPAQSRGSRLLPDYWLDTLDPVMQIAAWLGEPAAAGSK